MRKFTYLILALLVPALVFVFLKYTGSNRFEVPIYPLANAPLLSVCTGEVHAPYSVPDSVWRFMARKERQANVIIFPDAALDAAGLARAIGEEISGVTFLMGDALAVDSTLQARWKSCVFLLQPPLQGVLLDSQGRIRGQYDLRSLEETDRLRVEIKILMASY